MIAYTLVGLFVFWMLMIMWGIANLVARREVRRGYQPVGRGGTPPTTPRGGSAPPPWARPSMPPYVSQHQIQPLLDRIRELEAEVEKHRNRSAWCMYCGATWRYERGVDSPEAVIRDVMRHEETCEKNPMVAEIAELRRKLDGKGVMSVAVSIKDHIEHFLRPMRFAAKCKGRGATIRRLLEERRKFVRDAKDTLRLCRLAIDSLNTLPAQKHPGIMKAIHRLTWVTNQMRHTAGGDE